MSVGMNAAMNARHVDTPVSLHSSRREAVLCIEWPDGASARLSHARLRAACPCAQCRARSLRGGIAAVEEGVRLVAIHPQGYGVQLVFDDGHERGIYPWRYLRRLSQASP